MRGDKNHKIGCLWYETKIIQIDKRIKSLEDRKNVYLEMMSKHHIAQKEVAKNCAKRRKTSHNNDLKKVCKKCKKTIKDDDYKDYCFDCGQEELSKPIFKS